MKEWAFPKNKIDLVITDPPFAIKFGAKRATYNRTPSNVLSGYSEIKPENYYDFSFAWMSEVYRILKDDVWYIKHEYWTGDEKTLTKLLSELVKKLLAYSSEKRDVVLDPFIGSGQVAIVSKSMGRQFLGFEIVPDYYRFAKKRLDKDLYRIKKSK